MTAPQDETAEARNGLLRGVWHAVLIELVLIVGFGVAFVVVGAWGRW